MNIGGRAQLRHEAGKYRGSTVVAFHGTDALPQTRTT
jgi:hypothetical protein